MGKGNDPGKSRFPVNRGTVKRGLTVSLLYLGAHSHFAIDFWEKIIRMAKNCDNFFHHFHHNSENGEKIDGENGKKCE